MKMGFVSAILDGWNFEEMIDTASQLKFKCVEVACWPQGKAERRYAGVSHIDVDNLDDEKIKYINDYCKSKGRRDFFVGFLSKYHGWRYGEKNSSN
jgi:sugar phosphate isomerase/epimerase